MRVNHAEDHITHAVIGSQETRAFGINDSTEFFRILSSSLYSDKKLAVVREILCNAWDAHIEGKVTDKPIEIMIDNDKLMIRDRGPGLAPDDIFRLYTTYGGTSKLNNENVTGGFGLGSKAPFAYVDHFEVTSCHAGIKSIYTMSLSSAMVDGKPSVMKILDIPCGDETGIQVSLNLRDSHDRHAFEKLIYKIVANGEMNAVLNAQKLPTIDFSSSPDGYTILTADRVGNNAARIYIRYGHVIYPLEAPAELAGKLKSVHTFLNQIRGERKNHYGYYDYRDSQPEHAVVLQAPAGSISITPSRESLSMTDHTIKSISTLLGKFLVNINQGLGKHCLPHMHKAVDRLIETEDTVRLFHPKRVLPNISYFNNLKLALPKEIRSLQDAAAYYIANSHYPRAESFFQQDLDYRLKALVEAKIGDTKLLNSFRAELRHTSPLKSSSWFYRKILWPMIQDIDAEEEMSLKNLHVLDFGCDRFGQKRLLAQPYKNYEMAQARFCLPFLRKIVTLSHNRADVLDFNWANDRLTMRKTHGEITGSLLYIVPRNTKKIATARAFFEKRGYVINDFTPQQTIEAKPKDPNTPAVAAKPKRNGLPSLTNIDSVSHYASVENLYAEDNVLMEKPEFAVYISPNRQGCLNTIGNFQEDNRVIPSIIRLFGDRGVAVPSQISLDKLKEAGVATDLEAWMLPQILAEFKKNKLIREHYKNYRAPDVTPNGSQEILLKMIRHDDVLRRTFNLPTPVGQRERDFILIYESYTEYDRTRKDVLKDIHALVQTWKATASLKKLMEKLSNNVLLDCLKEYHLASLLGAKKPEVVERARKFFLYILKG